ncbi:DUF1652 domain-containing protein [Pseudomonas fluorescens]|uniref:DUF1652 domain-containing protein n=1 Tax=Pseudomonas fluorescens TaxID=294 RepID=A0A5E7F4A9_PSEFL|nr:DUF1652 domain-containing protein [Pseudomonas fluorescens]VVO34208.1 hypothetical protein PS691_05186 [Pseudomonas fluorescens]
MISLSLLRGYLEQSFLPLTCHCGLCPGSTLTVRVYDPVSGRVDMVVSGLRLETLKTLQDVQALIEELRYELQSNNLDRAGTA